MRTEQVLTRLNTDEKARVEAQRQRMQAEQPGARVTLSDAVRQMIYIASTPAAHPASVAPVPDEIMQRLSVDSIETSKSEPAAPKPRKAKANAA